ncbi:DNA alkylation repair protein [Cryptosporangium sp. NPDC051539]|uniref:DNA alkylation repair protein n=1 Tax=Cryptosporangium sp. NPDC051539 TaxID=3363962 RepID=UPI0037A1A9BB
MPFADELLSAATAENLARALATAAPRNPLTAVHAAASGLGGLALRARADLLRDALLADVPGGYRELADVVRTATPHLAGWMVWPVTTAVAARAVDDGSDEAFDDAMAILAGLTGLLTAEFAIRTLLRHDLGRALAIALRWAGSDDTDVRRLASEGTRPYLPWAVRVPGLSAQTIPILDALYRDPSDYVRRSVANHLNDLSRDHPELVVTTAARWLEAPDARTAQVVRHGLRTLVKRGDPGALALLGYGKASVHVDGPTLDADVVWIGDAIEFRATVRNTGDEAARLAIDYLVYHRKANGSQTAKTFKLTTATLQPGEAAEIRRAHSFRVITTRRYYPGPHAIALQVNGVATPMATFELR